MAITEGEILWQPSKSDIENANTTKFIQWLNEEKSLDLQSYDDLWKWSTEENEAYWEMIWKYFDVVHSQPYDQVMESESMIETKWFTGAQLNYAENLLQRINKDKIAIFAKSELRPLTSLKWSEVIEQAAALRTYLQKLGVTKGDRVAAYMPNIPETVIALLATASLGAVWSVCPPEFGVGSTLSRFQQIEPKVIITVDGYQYNGKKIDKQADVKEIVSQIPSIEQTIFIPYLNEATDFSELSSAIAWDEVLKETGELTFTQVGFDDPLWILYSSGTTGLPKAIVHSHGGMLLSQLTGQILQVNLKADDRYFWFTTTGWMLWNTVVGGLLAGSSIVLYDGSPTYPNDNALWELAEETKMTHFGTSPHYILENLKKGKTPKDEFDLSNLRSFAYTGAPLSPEGFEWVYDNVGENIRLIASAGGTDICGPIVTSNVLLPVYAGEIPRRSLGVAAASFNDKAEAVIDEIGELVITKPMPSMPIYFWGDEGKVRYQDSYYNVFPNVWRHGDLIKITTKGTAIIYGRSDATINRGGVRSGSSELYRAIEKVDEVLDSVVIDISGYQRESLLLLFVVLDRDATLDDAIKSKIKAKIREDVSPRHVPDEIYQVPSVPMTISGKKMEIPLRKILLGEKISEVVSVDAMRNPESIEYFAKLAKEIM